MSNEISITSVLQYTGASGASKFNLPSQVLAFNQTTEGMTAGIAVVGSGAEEDLPLGDVTTPGWLYLRNLDSANFVKYGPKSGGSMVEFGRLEASDVGSGDFVFLRLAPGTTLRWRADTADCRVQYALFEA